MNQSPRWTRAEFLDFVADVAQTLREAFDSVLVGFAVGVPRDLTKGYCTATADDVVCGTWDVRTGQVSA